MVEERVLSIWDSMLDINRVLLMSSVCYLSPDDKARDEGTKYPDDVVFVLHCSRTTKMFLHDLLATAALYL